MQIYELHKAGKPARELGEMFGISEVEDKGDLLGQGKTNIKSMIQGNASSTNVLLIISFCRYRHAI